MPNHVENIITFKGDKKKILEMLEAIKSNDYGLGTVDFNKITPMPESLNIEAGSRTDRGLNLYGIRRDVIGNSNVNYRFADRKLHLNRTSLLCADKSNQLL